MNWQDIKKLIEYPREGIFSKDLWKSDKVNVSLFCLAAGSEMSEHTSAKMGFVFVIEGEGIFNLEGKDLAMSNGALIAFEKNAVHSLRASQNTAFLLFLFQT